VWSGLEMPGSSLVWVGPGLVRLGNAGIKFVMVWFAGVWQGPVVLGAVWKYPDIQNSTAPLKSLDNFNLSGSMWKENIMGYDACAVAVIGVKCSPGVIKSALFKLGQERGCKHELPDGMNFCPECGAASYVTVSNAIDEYEDGEGDGDKLYGYELVHRGEGYYDDPEYIAYVTSGCVSARQSKSINLGELNLIDIEIEMKEKLEPLGLWDRKRFGLHVLLYESC